MTAMAAAPVGRREARREGRTLNEKVAPSHPQTPRRFVTLLANIRHAEGVPNLRRTFPRKQEFSVRFSTFLPVDKELKVAAGPSIKGKKKTPKTKHSDDDVNQRVLPQDRRADLSRTHLGCGSPT